MKLTCKAEQDRTYQVILDWGALSRLKDILSEHRISGSIYIVSDHNVFAAQGGKLLRALKGCKTSHFLVPPGETSKSLTQWRRVQDFLLKNGADRRSAVIAFGGGVVGDLAGFSASTFMRGLDFIQIPTTILSQSDSSIGAKVAVNHPAAKNLIGSFYQPRLVITDPSLLSTLPAREFSAGLGEAIKYGVIADPELFETLYKHIEKVRKNDRQLMGDLIRRCVSIKIRVVEEDERETGLRKILNFGHTIGHALEQATHYRRLRHGEAVAWGMMAAGFMAIHRGLWDTGEFEKLKSIITRAGCLYPFGRIKQGQILEALKHDKKKTGKDLNFVLPIRTGAVTIVKDIQEREVLNALDFIYSL